MNRSCLLLLFAACLTSTANAQVQIGTPPFGTFAGGPDVIDIANLNSHLTIPIIRKPGRGGLNFIYNVTYDSAIWFPASVNGGTVWQPIANWGLNGTSFGYVSSVQILAIPCISGFQQTGTAFTYSWGYVDAMNTKHGFGTTIQVSGTCSQYSTTSLNAAAGDGSGYTISATGADLISLKNAAGQNLTGLPFNGPSPDNILVEDRNGNEITSNSTGVFTDTLGTTVFTVAGSGTPSSPVTLTYAAPSGANAVYTEKFTAKTVQTAFGCSGVSEFGPQTENLVSEIDLPDIAVVPSDKYTFTYEQTPGVPANVTGRVASITLPTGGTISFSYSGGSNGITCSDGIAATLTRSVNPGGTWTYVHSEGSSWATSVTDPQGNKKLYTFSSIFESEEQVYSGASTLLRTVFSCFNSTLPNCSSTVTTPITSRAMYVQWPSGQESETNTNYDSFGLPTEEDDYDYGPSAPGNLIRKTLISYASLGNGINNMPSQVTIQNGSGTTVAQTSITYDQGSVVAPPSGSSPQHVSISGSRGNPTTVAYLVGGSATLSRTFTYYDTGNVDVATDVNGARTTFNYPDSGTSTCGNAFPASVTEPLGLSKSVTWKCGGGVQASVTDENGQASALGWTDAYFWRPATSTDQGGNQTAFSYPSPTTAESSMAFNAGASVVDILRTLDGLGRIQITQQREAPNSSNFDSIESDNDSIGHPCRATIPYVGTAGQTDGTATCSETSGPATIQTYDGLSRPLVTTDGGGGTITLTYTGNDVLQSIGPKPAGENTKDKRSEYNSIGQLTSVCEVTSLTGSGTCGQTTSGTGYWTKYTYDVIGHLLAVTQNAQSSSTQSRTYAYDGLGRMLSEANPETGTINYVYDTDSSGTCTGTYNSDLVKKTDAAGNVTCYTYDALHRVTSITYPSGPNSANTPSKHFVYDSAAVNSIAMANAKIRLAEAYTCTSSCTTKLTDEGFSYTVRGEVSDIYESTPHSSGYFHVTEAYWANGGVNQISGLAGFPTLTYGVDPEGRPYSVSASSGQNPVTSTFYNAASEATLVNFGSLDNDTFQFDTGTFRMTQYKYSVGTGPKTVVGNLTWNANGTLGSLGITDAFVAANTQNCTYSYDDLARIASANCGSSVWSQTFSYDAFGNITKTGSGQFQPLYSSSTNQMTSIGSFTPSYDTNGDVLNDSLHTYAWDSDTRPTTIDTVTVTYDALDRMVEQSKSGVNTEIVYDCRGNKLALMNGISTLVKAFAPLPGGATAVYNASGLQSYRHADWLGGSRFASTPTRSMYNDLAFAPFGETYARGGSNNVTDLSFAGNHEDTTGSLYDAQFREYGIQGRWPSPDPAGFAAANPANPQSWNRYAYVVNNPLLLSDPSGERWISPHSFAIPYVSSTGLFAAEQEFDLLMIELYVPSSSVDTYVSNTVTGPGISFTISGLVDSASWDSYEIWIPAPDPYPALGDLCGGGDCVNPDPSPQKPQSPTQTQPTQTQPQQPQPPGWCTAMENGGTTVVVVAGGVFVWGTVADATGIGAPAGLLSQGSAVIGGTLGAIVDGLGKLGKAAGVCH